VEFGGQHDRRQIRATDYHADSTRSDYLRAGCDRGVLPVDRAGEHAGACKGHGEGGGREVKQAEPLPMPKGTE